MITKPVLGTFVGLNSLKEPKEGRAAIVFASPFVFATGLEQFSVNTDSTANNFKPSQILTLWADATSIPSGKNIYLAHPLGKIVIPGGQQGYKSISCSMPLGLQITADTGANGNFYLQLFNFEIPLNDTQAVQNIAGTIVATIAANASMNLNQVGGTAIALGGAVTAASIPVNVATDNIVKVLLQGSPAGTFSIQSSWSSGLSVIPLSNVGAAQTVKPGAGGLYGYTFINNNAATVFVEFFDSAAPVLGTTVPKFVVGIPASSSVTLMSNMSLQQFSNAITVAAVTAYNGTTAGSVTGTVIYS